MVTEHRLSGLVNEDPEEDEAAWDAGVLREWAAELSDTRQDIYTLEDGKPVDAAS